MVARNHQEEYAYFNCVNSAYIGKGGGENLKCIQLYSLNIVTVKTLTHNIEINNSICQLKCGGLIKWGNNNKVTQDAGSWGEQQMKYIYLFKVNSSLTIKYLFKAKLFHHNI